MAGINETRETAPDSPWGMKGKDAKNWRKLTRPASGKEAPGEKGISPSPIGEPKERKRDQFRLRVACLKVGSFKIVQAGELLT